MNTLSTKVLTDQYRQKIVNHAVTEWMSESKDEYYDMTEGGKAEYRRKWLLDFCQSHYPDAGNALLYANTRMREGLERYTDAAPTSPIINDEASTWAQGLRIKFGQRLGDQRGLSSIEAKYTKLLESGHMIPSDYVVALLLNREVDAVAEVRENIMRSDRWRLEFESIGGGWHVIDVEKEWRKIEQAVRNLQPEDVKKLLERIEAEKQLKQRQNVSQRHSR